MNWNIVEEKEREGRTCRKFPIIKLTKMPNQNWTNIVKDVNFYERLTETILYMKYFAESNLIRWTSMILLVLE